MIACKATYTHMYQLRLKIAARKILPVKAVNSSSKQVFCYQHLFLYETE